MTEITVCIPVGPGHDDLAQRAIQSVEGQTTHCALSVVWDADGKGAGWARNRALEQVYTPYVLFLDADDWLVPDAAARFLAAAQAHPNRYVYCDYYQGGRVHEEPDCVYCPPFRTMQGHTITALLPTDWVRAVGGFDESLPAIEDTDFWLKLRYVGRHDGHHLPRPLFHYSSDGWRSRQIAKGINPQTGHPIFTPLHAKLRAQVHPRYEGLKPMGCCGQSVPVAPQGERQPDDVLAMPLWTGNKRIVGHATGRVYRGSYGREMYIAPADLAAMPRLFRGVS